MTTPLRLPEGWEWVDDSHKGISRDGVGALNWQHNVLVQVQPPEWTCPWCGTTERISSPCISSDFLDDETRAEILLQWKHRQRDGAILKVHGVGAPKVVFDMVWNRWVTKLWERTDG